MADRDVPQATTSLVSLIGKRGRTGMQKRGCRWLEHHPGAACYGMPIKEYTDIEPNEGDILLGTFRIPPEFFTGKDPQDVSLFWEKESKQWVDAYIEPYANAVVEAHWPGDLSWLPQSAVLACTGMTDEELAKFLKVKPATVRSWYREKDVKQMPAKVIAAIAKTFVTDSELDLPA